MRIDDFRVRDDLLYCIPAGRHSAGELAELLGAHPEVYFVSFSGVDIAGNDTDEKIPVSRFLEALPAYLSAGVQTDGSSVVLPCIATINNAQIDLIADPDVHWYVDYNYENIDRITGKPWGTLRIPCFLVHNGDMVCARSALKRALIHADRTLRQTLSPAYLQALGIDPAEVVSYDLAAATELEFWVRTPDDIIDREHLSTSQTLKEQYWKRTKGIVRTALEQSLRLLDLYGFAPEMGHKEVGGVKARLHESGSMDHILEQLEIDWQYTAGMQAADNELAIRILVKEIFRLHGLEASFMAKPLPGVAGNGEHTHMNFVATLRDGSRVNLFTPADPAADYLSVPGYGALLGLLKHYGTLVAPFVSCSIDAFNRLKPGFEAPTHVSVSIGMSEQTPTRNRTVLVCLIRSPESPEATRFELRSPHPHSNMYFVMAAASQAMLDGIRHAVLHGRSQAELLAELTAPSGADGLYLPVARAYRTEVDIFDVYTADERDRLFGRPAATVHDTLKTLMESDTHAVLFDGRVFDDRLLRAYTKAMLDAWELELRDRILSTNLERIRQIKPSGETTPHDAAAWQRIDARRAELAKTDGQRLSVFDAIRHALDKRDLAKAAELHAGMDAAMAELEDAYERYRKNQINGHL